MNKIAFIGLGNMGGGMAANLLKKGYQVIGFDLNQSALQKFESLGGIIAESSLKAAKNVAAVISMLPSGEHVNQLYSLDFLKELSKNTLLIDCSTIDVETAQHVALRAKGNGLSMIDAPVSGGTIGAAQGTLTFIVGGESDTFQKAKPILEAMGNSIFHAGNSGAGQIAKICNNMLLGIHMIGTCEALNLGLKHGLDAKVLSAIMQKSSGNNWSLEKYNPEPNVLEHVPASNNYQGGFMVDLMAKDLNLADQAASGAKASIPLGALALQLYKIWSSQGNGTKDFSSIIQFLKA